MKCILEIHKICLEVKTPVYIGSGKNISKKDYYIDNRNNRIIVFQEKKFIDFLMKKRLIQSYEQYLIYGKTLNLWMSQNKITLSDLKDCIEYSVDASEVDLKNLKPVNTFIKDAYGRVYVPGSSIKGALRTALMGSFILQNQSEKNIKKNQICEAVKNEEFIKRNTYLSKENEELSTLYMHEKIHDKPVESIVNDIMAGVRITDSEPLPSDCLVLCQKHDVKPYYVQDKNKVNILREVTRECLRPGTRIYFTLEIDRSIFPDRIKYIDILKCIKNNFEFYEQSFLNKFEKCDEYGGYNICLGGGVGFNSKTVLYQMFGQNEAVRVAAKVIQNTLSRNAKKEHAHDKDLRVYKISPHVKKCTKYNGVLADMGICEWKTIKIR